MIYDFKGLNENVITLPASNTVKVGCPVVINEELASLAAANLDFLGICTSVADGVATVQVSGYVEIKASGITGYGYASIASNGTEGIKKYDSAVRKAYIFKIDSAKGTVGFIL